MTSRPVALAARRAKLRRLGVSLRRGRGRTALVWLAVGAGLVLAVLAIGGAQPSAVWASLKDSEYEWLAPALAAHVVFFVLRAVRWRVLFAPASRPPFRPLASALLVGYLFNSVLPWRAGEPARVVALNRSTRVPLAEVGATAVVERVLDLAALLVLLFLTLPWLPDLTWLNAAAALAAVLAVVMGAVVIMLRAYGARPLTWATRPLARLPFVGADAVPRLVENLDRGLIGVRSGWIALQAFVWTTLSWLVLGAAFWLVTLSFDLELPPLSGLLVVIAIGLAMIIPSPPGALGIFEAATVVALGAYDVEASLALAYALVLHAVNLVPFVVVGLVALYVESTRARAGAPAGRHAPPPA